MTATKEVQHEERWEALAMLLAEVLRRILEVPRPEHREAHIVPEETVHSSSDPMEEVSS